jgi:polyphosphate kinase
VVRNVEPDRFVIITLPSILQRYVTVTDVDPGVHAFIILEDLITMQLHQFFPGEQVKGSARFRMSRNSDIEVDEAGSGDLATEMAEVLEARRSSPTIRIEIQQGASRTLEGVIKDLCGRASKPHIFTIPGELDLRSLWTLAGLSGFEELKVETWEPQPSSAIEPDMSMFEVIKRKDLMLHHPFESFEPVLQLIEEAASDPDVVAIKQILYRTAKNSRIINALIKAAEAGKHVTVLVELKARFDEARNLERAEDLINAGAQIIYGVRGLKTHAKIALIMRREAGHMMRYMHFGTGNYNEATSKLYTDVSYLTCRSEYGADASAFFNTVTGRSRFQHFERLSMAPFGLRERVLGLIASEVDRARAGEPAEITLKMNSLEDREMILALYKASQAGVKIRLNVRGICCLRPGVAKVSENIRVVSIIDRYLEHARIFCFRQGGAHAVFIGSADFMNRNLSKRVELLIPVDDNAARKRLVSILETHFADNTQAHVLMENGRYRLNVDDATPVRSQEVFAREAVKRAKQAAQSPDLLVPHLPKIEK